MEQKIQERIRRILETKRVNVFNKQYLFDQFLKENNMDPNIRRINGPKGIYKVARQYFIKKYDMVISDDEFFFNENNDE